jgi:hypothetical protein
MANLPSREYLLECFDYDKETDTLTWRKRPAEHFKSAKSYRKFNTQFANKEIKESITIGKIRARKSKVIFKIVNGFEPPRMTHQKGFIQKQGNYIRGIFKCENKVFQKSFKTEPEAKNWVKEMRIKFEKNRLPIVKNKKVSKHGFHGVYVIKGIFYAHIGFNKEYYRIRCNSAKEASNAYQLAKQQIKDGVFVPPKKLISNTGYKGVKAVYGGRFQARYKGKSAGTFYTAEESHAAYLKAKNHKTFDDGLDILAKLAQQYG